ncbi:MAG: sigma-70 family RNA polymerase sigma factor [Planctomycetaceae bacterium]|nr:sigma-70 family RNA polymerase sigma factor [Planctomycetaceae bacterium]
MQRFVQRFEGLVYGLSLRMLRRREDAEDVAQDVFLRTFRSLKRWDADRPLAPWLIAITANRCRTALDRRSRTATFAPVAEQASEAIASPAELAEELQLALSQLRPEYRRCFELFYRKELCVAAVAEHLGVPQGTIKTWLYRARKELADHLERRGVTPDVKS